MISTAALRFVNHLLGDEAWARDRLRPYAGKRVRVEAGALTVNLIVDETGLLRLDEDGQDADVCLTLPADAPLRMIQDRNTLIAEARISGPAELTETLAFVFRNLRWDVEADLATWLGDAAAHRLARFGRSMAVASAAFGERLAGNIADYFVGERHALATHGEADTFAREARSLEERSDRLER